jgi:hypothetical protein
MIRDTGRSNTDRITNDLLASIVGDLSDDREVIGLKGSINETQESAFTDLTPRLDSQGRFRLDLQLLQSLAKGRTLLNDGEHTLFLKATDSLGNSHGEAGQPPLVAISFAYDTTAPVVPGVPNLLASSDSGASDSDNITNISRPTFAVTSEADAEVELRGDRAGVLGKLTSPGNLTFTSPNAFADGVHQLTAVATDIAGNASSPSPSLTLKIDTQCPESLQLDFPAITNETDVLISGTTEPNARIRRRSQEAIADSSTAFRLAGVPLDFGENLLEILAEDIAGNQNNTFHFQVTKAES